MMEQTKTAIIKSIRVGKVDHCKGIILSCDFDMNGTGTGLTFSMDEAAKMMDDCKIYDNINSLVGKPCEIYIDDKNTCHFKGMWK